MTADPVDLVKGADRETRGSWTGWSPVGRQREVCHALERARHLGRVRPRRHEEPAKPKAGGLARQDDAEPEVQ